MYPEYFLGKSDDYILDFYNKYGKDQYHIINEEEYQERREKTRKYDYEALNIFYNMDCFRIRIIRNKIFLFGS